MLQEISLVIRFNLSQIAELCPHHRVHPLAILQLLRNCRVRIHRLWSADQEFVEALIDKALSLHDSEDQHVGHHPSVLFKNRHYHLLK